jgi:hypothetical protein
VTVGVRAVDPFGVGQRDTGRVEAVLEIFEGIQ